MKSKIFNKETGIYTLLFLLSFGVYFFYYQQLILNLNAVLFKAEGDSIKNYYTFVYHIKNDTGLLNFSGLNFPFGEHVVYTDCQPLLTFILKALPFTHHYLIGIMHGLILFSYIITPLILFRIFSYLDVNAFVAFFSSLAIAFLAPQTLRLGGHFALAYNCIIPAGIMFLLGYFKNPSSKKILLLFAYNTCLFLIHPYFGLGLSIFCFISILTTRFFNYNKFCFLKKAMPAFIAGILPIVAFKIFMFITDHHINRPDEPYGDDIMAAAANAESVFTPSFGPFIFFLKGFIRAKHVEWEALCYIGIFAFFLLLLSFVLLPFYYKKIFLKKELIALFISSLIFLFLSFGGHIQFLKLFDIEIATLNQFRAFGRFAWYFYFLLPVFLTSLVNNVIRSFNIKAEKIILAFFSVSFFFFNMLEAHYLLRSMTQGVFTDRNIFNSNKLSPDEKNTLALLKNKNIQAIMPLPLFHIGSEVYQRNGSESITTAMIYSYHAGLPILSVMLSRTSLNETESAIEILNPYKKNRPIETLIGKQPMLVIKTGDNQKEDELRLLRKLTAFNKYGDHGFYLATGQQFNLNEYEKSRFITVDAKNDPAKNIIFIPFENRKPFVSSFINDYENIVVLDSNSLAPGDYTVSFRYHLKAKIFRYINSNLIVVKKNDPGTEDWPYYSSVRSASGFYPDFIVFEQRIKIENHFVYKFMLNGALKEPYYISDFLLKPESLDVKMKLYNKDVYNNYPAN